MVDGDARKSNIAIHSRNRVTIEQQGNERSLMEREYERIDLRFHRRRWKSKRSALVSPDINPCDYTLSFFVVGKYFLRSNARRSFTFGKRKMIGEGKAQTRFGVL